MKKEYSGKLLFYIFLIFFGVCLIGIWIDKATGWEHERSQKNSAFTCWGNSEELKKLGYGY
jgi:hypothetical protein